MPRTQNYMDAVLIAGLCSDDGSEARSVGACLPHKRLKLARLVNNWVEALKLKILVAPKPQT